MAVQDHTDRDEVNDEDYCRAKPGERYPIRILHMIDDSLIIGFVVKVFPDTVMVLRPFQIGVDFSELNQNIEAYDFEPYLNQLADNDPTELDPVPFMTATLKSVVRPASHVVRNYSSMIQLRETIFSISDDEEIDILHARGNPNTIH